MIAADISDIPKYRYLITTEEPYLITENKTVKAILNTGPDKAPGPDGIPNRILHLVARVTLILIKRLFQACLDQGVQPDSFKSVITIILRKANKEDYIDPSSYRLIVLFNILGKVLKAVISNYIRYVVETYRLFPET